MERIKFGYEDEKVTYAGMTMTYTQDCDLRSDDSQELKIEVCDNGGGMYFVIKTDRWAIEDVAELINVLNDFKSRL